MYRQYNTHYEGFMLLEVLELELLDSINIYFFQTLAASFHCKQQNKSEHVWHKSLRYTLLTLKELCVDLRM